MTLIYQVTEAVTCVNVTKCLEKSGFLAYKLVSQMSEIHSLFHKGQTVNIKLSFSTQLRLSTGDFGNFDEAYAILHSQIRKIVARRIQQHPCDNDDIILEIWVKVLNGLTSGSFQPRTECGGIHAWVSLIARNTAYDHLRTCKRTREVEWTSETENNRLTVGPVPHNFTKVPEENEVIQVLATSKDLNPSQKRCLALRFIFGLSVRETAQAMGVSLGAVKLLQHRATLKSRKILRQNGYTIDV